MADPLERSKVGAFLAELKRRHVYQVAVVYAAVAFVIWQVCVIAFPALDLPDWTVTLVVVLTIVGFPVAVVLAWAYERTPEGLVRDVPAAAVEEPEAGAVAPVIGTVEDERKAIVVLPFDNMSPDPDNAYFADGLTEELIADLSNVEALRVTSRTSAMSFKGTRKDIPTIARELNVRYVLEGSVRRADDALRITAQLIDAHADSHLWAEKYSGSVEDIFELQEQLSRQIAGALELKLSADEETRLAERPISDVQAYEHYLRARGNIVSFDGPSIERAIRDLKSGLDILGDNALLLRALGMARFQEINTGLTEDPGVIDSIEECGRRIRELDPTDAGSFLLMGLAHWMRGDCASAVISLREAYQRDRSDHDILMFLGVTSLSTGQMDTAGGLVHELHRVDPLSPLSALLVGFHHLFGGRFEESADFVEQALELGPDVIIVQWTAVRAFVSAGKADRAETCAAFLSSRDPSSAYSQSADLFVRGLTDKSDNVPEPSTALQTFADRDCELAQYLSDAYAFAGDGKKALACLETAFRTGFMNHDYLSRHDPFIAAFRDSHDWQAVLTRVRNGKEEFESRLMPLR